MNIAKEVQEEAVLSQRLLQEGFLHALKAGELLHEVKLLLHSEEEFEGWIEKNCSQVERRVLDSSMRLFNGEKVSVEASKKQGERG